MRFPCPPGAEVNRSCRLVPAAPPWPIAKQGFGLYYGANDVRPDLGAGHPLPLVAYADRRQGR